MAFSAENLEQLRRNALRVHFLRFLQHFWGPGACLALPPQHFASARGALLRQNKHFSEIPTANKQGKDAPRKKYALLPSWIPNLAAFQKRPLPDVNSLQDGPNKWPPWGGGAQGAGLASTKQGLVGATAHMWHTSGAQVTHMWPTCGTHVAHMWHTCGTCVATRVAQMWHTCGTQVTHM